MEIKTLYDVFITSTPVGKAALIALAYGEKHPSGVDSALPQQWVEKVRELIPDFDTSYWVWDCNTWRPVNLLEKIHQRYRAMDNDQRAAAAKAELKRNFFTHCAQDEEFFD